MTTVSMDQAKSPPKPRITKANIHAWLKKQEPKAVAGLSSRSGCCLIANYLRAKRPELQAITVCPRTGALAIYANEDDLWQYGDDLSKLASAFDSLGQWGEAITVEQALSLFEEDKTDDDTSND